jgi:hypothetical protein
MPFVNPDATLLDQANRVQALHESICDLWDALGKGEPDARHVNLNNICMATNAALGTLRLWHAAVADEGKGLAVMLGCEQSHLNMIQEDMLRAAKLFLLLEFQFQTETLYATVTKAVGASPAKMGFYNIAKATLEAVGLADADAKLGILTVPAKMRTVCTQMVCIMDTMWQNKSRVSNSSLRTVRKLSAGAGFIS